MIKDRRPTRVVDETRCMGNFKPWRNKQERKDARAESFEGKGRNQGATLSYAPRHIRSTNECQCKGHCVKDAKARKKYA